MTADSMDLEDCDNFFKGFVGSIFDDMVDANFLDSPKSQPVLCPSNSFSDMKYSSDIPDITSFKFEDFSSIVPLLDDPFAGCYLDTDCKMRSCDADMSLQNSSLLDMEPDFSLTVVSPNLVLPNSASSSSDVPDSIFSPTEYEDAGDEALESVWPEVSELNDENLVKIVDSGYLKDEFISIDDMFQKKKRRKLTYLDFDHCYSIRPLEDDEDDYADFDYFNSSPYSPASSSCSDKTRGVKRTRPKRKAVKHVKIKQEVISSDEEEVDVETPCPVSLVVPKITISIAPPPVKVGPAKRGRKPKNRNDGPFVKKSNYKNCPVSAKDLQAAIKQQRQKCYITKSGRVTKISNSVETTPSTSTPSSLSNSRCNSDNEDSVDKRASHNMAERNRRQELTNLFQNLRMTVPEIEHNPKASKVCILTTSSKFVKKLQTGDKTQMSEKQQLKAKLEKNLALLQSLKSGRVCSR